MLLSVEVRTPERPPKRPLANCRAPHEKENVVVVGFRSILAGAALLASTAAVSADGYYGGAKDTLIVPGYPASWYLRGDYSHAWVNVGDVAMPSFSFRDHSDDRTWAAGGGVGYYFGRGIRGDVTYEWRGGRRYPRHHPDGQHGPEHRELGAAGQPLLRLPRRRALDALYRRRPRRGPPRHQRRPGRVDLRRHLHLRRIGQLDGGRRADGGRELAHRPRPSRPRQHQGRAGGWPSPAGCTSTSATASSTSATRTRVRSSMWHRRRPDRASTTSVAHELRIGLRWDIR